jgi:hypothetical protein
VFASSAIQGSNLALQASVARAVPIDRKGGSHGEH